MAPLDNSLVAEWATLFLNKHHLLYFFYCIQAKVFALGQSGCIRAKWLYSSKVAVLGQNGCIRAK